MTKHILAEDLQIRWKLASGASAGLEISRTTLRKCWWGEGFSRSPRPGDEFRTGNPHQLKTYRITVLACFSYSVGQKDTTAFFPAPAEVPGRFLWYATALFLGLDKPFHAVQGKRCFDPKLLQWSEADPCKRSLLRAYRGTPNKDKRYPEIVIWQVFRTIFWQALGLARPLAGSSLL